ncbi:uncharacterized protein [Apostichopus japonicus]|uniref:uncharacterized protein n=1 Tax=Stichopus japonicus TaxID=307972 RepID=UPI003AB6714C
MHVKDMKQESTKKQQDEKKIKSLMAKTFGHRRSFILERKPVIDIKDTYRLLSASDMIIQDFSTLCDWQDISEEFFRNLDDIANNIINFKMINHSKGTLYFLLDYWTHMQRMLSPEENANYTINASRKPQQAGVLQHLENLILQLNQVDGDCVKMDCTSDNQLIVGICTMLMKQVLSTVIVWRIDDCGF